MNEPVLELPGLGLRAAAGEIVSLRGPGAAGVWEQVCGISEGAGPVVFEGKDVSAWTPQQRRRVGLLALFERPAAATGMTIIELMRPSAGATSGLRRAACQAAADLGLDAGMLDLPLDDSAWRPHAAAAEWLQAVCLRPRLVVSAADVNDNTAGLARALAKGGAAVVIAAPAQALKEARRVFLP